MKIVLIQHLGFLNGQGGTEKICSFLANGFAAEGHEVTIATCENIKGEAVYPLKEGIKVVNIYNSSIIQYEPKQLYNYRGKNPLLWIKYKIKKKQAKAYNRRLNRKLGREDGLYLLNLRQRSNTWKKYIEGAAPNLIVTMSIGSLLEITYRHTYNIPIINSTNGRPDYDYTDVLWHRGKAEMQELTKSFQHLSATQVLFESYKNFLPDTFKGWCEVIPNPVPQMATTVDHLKKKERYSIIQIASLVTSKQQDIAIDLFATTASQFPEWDLHFWGTGFAHNTLQKKITQYNLADRVFLNGFTATPMAQLLSADIFIFPSQFEGFPLALTEAMSAGLPAIGFASCSGVNELIIHGQTGFLANNKEEMQQCLLQLIKSPEERKRLGENAHEHMKAYNPEIVMAKWQKLVHQITGQ
jgi:glycosyltransferase involved in cell wall biosynthesis